MIHLQIEVSWNDLELIIPINAYNANIFLLADAQKVNPATKCRRSQKIYCPPAVDDQLY